ncbi:hypothetical protein Tco_0051637 [Tanacetum coccineum]
MSSSNSRRNGTFGFQNLSSELERQGLEMDCFLHFQKMTSATQEEPSEIDTFYRLHTVNGVFQDPEALRMYDRMRELEATGEHTTAEINAMVRGGKLRGHIPGVGPVMPGYVRSRLSYTAPVDRSRDVDFMMSLMRSDNRFADAFARYDSGGASGSGGSRARDREDGDDTGGEDGGDDTNFFRKKSGNAVVQAVYKKNADFSPATCPWGKSCYKEKTLRRFPSDMSLGNIMPPWHQFLDQKIRGAHFSLGIVAGEHFAIELTPSTFPQRHFAGDMFPQRHVAGERVGILAFASILVNGSPTNEFKLERGLRQGDPLSPFLFILAVEELNIALLEATNNNIFHGVKVDNARNLSRIFTCFHLASSLKANFNKSKLFGIRVNTIELNSLASTIGCQASQFPCMYLGLPVGAKMSRCLNWSPLVERFQKRLSKWKSKNLSFCGRLTLIRSVLDSLGVYYFSTFKTPKKTINKLECIRRKFFWGRNLVENKITWIARKKVISPINHGGLGIGSLKSSNQAMLSKWWWRFGTDGNSLWCNIIRSIHEPSRVSMSLVSKVKTRSMVPYYKAKR